MCYALGVAWFSCSVWAESVVNALPPPSIDFENTNLWNKAAIYPLDEFGNLTGEGGDSYWLHKGFMHSTEPSYIRKYDSDSKQEGAVTPYKFSDYKTSTRPAYMQDYAYNEGYLNAYVNTGVFWRTFWPLKRYGEVDIERGAHIPVGEQFFMDMLVQMYVDENLPNPAELCVKSSSLTNGNDKASVILYRPKDAGDDAPGTLVVSAAYLDEEDNLQPINFITTNTLKNATWHRLTARIIANASTKSDKKFAAMVFYVDGVQLACAAGNYPIAKGAEHGEEASYYFDGNEYYENRALFPVLQKVGDDWNAEYAYAIGMEGKVYLDEISIVTNQNPFPKSVSAIQMKIVCEDKAVKTFAYTRNSEAPVVLEHPNGSTIEVEPGDIVVFEPVATNCWTFSPDLLLTGNTTAYDHGQSSGWTVKMIDGSFPDSGNLVVSFSATASYFNTEDGQSFTKFDDAVEHAQTTAGHLIELSQDVTLSQSARADNGQAWIKPGREVVIDLKGHTVKGDHWDNEAAIYNQGKLTIIDTIGAGVIEAPGTNTIIATDAGVTTTNTDWSVVKTNIALHADYDRTLLTLGATTSMTFKVKGRVKCTEDAKMVIRSGEYLSPEDGDDTDPGRVFYLNSYVDDSGAFSVYGPTTNELEGIYWKVDYNHRQVVTFEVPHGTVDPKSKSYEPNSTIDAPVWEAAGYNVTNWYDVATGEAWKFGAGGTEITNNVTIMAQMEAISYPINYDKNSTKASAAENPATYTVETPYTVLNSPTRRYYDFVGWYDIYSNRYVNAIGAKAKFAGTDEPVVGELNLKAQWAIQTQKWENASLGLTESNGWVQTTWQLKLPTPDAMQLGDEMKIHEIAFSVVNPLTGVKTAPRLNIQGNNVNATSATRELPELAEYRDKFDQLENGRCRIVYKFNDLTLKIGAKYYLNAVDEGGNEVTNFLRVAVSPSSEEMAIGTSTSAGYERLCPIYEIIGEAAEE